MSERSYPYNLHLMSYDGKTLIRKITDVEAVPLPRVGDHLRCNELPSKEPNVYIVERVTYNIFEGRGALACNSIDVIARGDRI